MVTKLCYVVHLICMGKTGNVYIILVEKPLGKQDTIKMGFRIN
jgi:hypothetical protein